MGPEFIDPDELATNLIGLLMFDQHPVTEKFPADGGTAWVYNADKSWAIGILSGKKTFIF